MRDEEYRRIIPDDESLMIFLRGMKKFDTAFAHLMGEGIDFTLRLEVHGNAGKLLQCRAYRDEIERPRSCGANVK